jgi:hypothetical protein
MHSQTPTALALATTHRHCPTDCGTLRRMEFGEHGRIPFGVCVRQIADGPTARALHSDGLAVLPVRIFRIEHQVRVEEHAIAAVVPLIRGRLIHDP